MALAYMLRPEYAITIDYGHCAAEAEVKSASMFCSEVNLTHEVIRIDCSEIGLGIMMRAEKVARAHRIVGVPPSPEWWPFRNQLLITIGAARAVVLGTEELYVGAVISDRVHADGDPGFYRTLDDLLGIQEGGIRLKVPAIGLSSVELVRSSKIPMALLGWSHSCHRGNLACGLCRGCIKHQVVIREFFDRSIE